MIHEMTSHKPDPNLGLALSQSIQSMHEEQRDLKHLMMHAKELHGDLPETTPVTFGKDTVLPYCSPDKLDGVPSFVENYCKHIITQLDAAKTLEKQESIILDEMRQLLELSMVGAPHRLQATCAIQTLALMISEYQKSDTPVPEAVEDMGERLTYYAQIAFESMECCEGLVYRYQRKRGISDEQMWRTPFALAVNDMSKPLCLAGQTPPEPDYADAEARAKSILKEMCEDYGSSMPIPMPADALGLILRCTDRLAELELHKAPAPLRCRKNDNDNAPDETELLLDNPLIRRRVNHILGQVFLKHLDAARSPQSIMNAAQSLEDAIILEERRGGINR